ncbi:MAG: hypothetical protein JXR51_06195 [Bacteroidales bacterium]|nr:hypothetical protein [Bacteroidales bacterium]MBN2756751.1 hypothetical protein [Bacteroidales bacterium]
MLPNSETITKKEITEFLKDLFKFYTRTGFAKEEIYILIEMLNKIDETSMFIKKHTRA